MRELWPTVQFQKSHKSTIKVVHMTPYALYSCEIIVLWSQRKLKKSKNVGSFPSPYNLRTTGLSILCTFSILLSFFPSLFFHSLSFFLSVFLRHEGRTWSLERTDSVLSDCPSGMMSSSVGTSKCNSPACMEARARRAAHCGFTEPHRPALQYGDSFDSLGDSPHSDRCAEAPSICSHGTENHFSVCSKTPLRFSARSPLPLGSCMGGVKDSIANIHSMYHQDSN